MNWKIGNSILLITLVVLVSVWAITINQRLDKLENAPPTPASTPLALTATPMPVPTLLALDERKEAVSKAELRLALHPELAFDFTISDSCIKQIVEGADLSRTYESKEVVSFV